MAEGIAFDDLLRQLLGQPSKNIPVGGTFTGNEPQGGLFPIGRMGQLGLDALNTVAPGGPSMEEMEKRKQNELRSGVGGMAGGLAASQAASSPQATTNASDTLSPTQAEALRKRARESLRGSGVNRQDATNQIYGGGAAPAQSAPPASDLGYKIKSIMGPGYAADGSGRRVVPELSDFERLSPYAMTPDMRASRIQELEAQKRLESAEKIKGMDTTSAEKIANIQGSTARDVAKLQAGNDHDRFINSILAAGGDLTKLEPLMQYKESFKPSIEGTPSTTTPGPAAPGKPAAVKTPEQVREAAKGKMLEIPTEDDWKEFSTAAGGGKFDADKLATLMSTGKLGNVPPMEMAKRILNSGAGTKESIVGSLTDSIIRRARETGQLDRRDYGKPAGMGGVAVTPPGGNAGPYSLGGLTITPSEDIGEKGFFGNALPGYTVQGPGGYSKGRQRKSSHTDFLPTYKQETKDLYKAESERLGKLMEQILQSQ